jgi:hypothetical protein
MITEKIENKQNFISLMENIETYLKTGNAENIVLSETKRGTLIFINKDMVSELIKNNISDKLNITIYNNDKHMFIPVNKFENFNFESCLDFANYKLKVLQRKAVEPIIKTMETNYFNKPTQMQVC